LSARALVQVIDAAPSLRPANFSSVEA
jgi:hypothetical protein